MAARARRVIGDWGSTRLRLFLVENGETTARLDGPGVTQLVEPAERVLARLLSVWLATGRIEAITLCGMVGSPAGLAVAPYAPCPVDAEGWHRARTRLRVLGHDVEILPGLSYRTAIGVPEVMRGEETQVFGAMVLNPALREGERLFALPGTHGKWVSTCDGAITDFRTAPTGEVFAAITGHTSLTGPDTPGEGSFDDGFGRGLARSAEPLPGTLFEARAARLLDGRSRDWAKGYLSGVLIGAEVAQFGMGTQNVTLIGDPALAALYASAIAHHGGSSQQVDGESAVVAGLSHAITLAESLRP
ncbi:2-dehydro-3-deoxygalactonokinase [Novosphingobium sp. THN1]|uniref:2-dehydro-3-deoxygalactonokinase n=1 Tax=Novosphingobium sp. THN1 TaxID=1016987 RepID=UPI001F0765BF|nr:2-dehydro-3-deoxygalactonokinase [Novosphingobium sp. THN1]